MSKKNAVLQPLDRSKDRALGIKLSPSNQALAARVEQRVRGKRIILLQISKEAKGRLPRQLGSSKLDQLMFGNPSLYTGQGRILEGEGQWSELGREPTYRFNCHSYALGQRVGITPNDWVEGSPTDLVDFTCPMEILLGLYFKCVKSISLEGGPEGLEALMHDQTIQPDDIISFLNRETKHLHSGLARRVGDENWLASKIAAGRLVIAPIPDILFAYFIGEETFGNAEFINVYRFRGD